MSLMSFGVRNRMRTIMNERGSLKRRNRIVDGADDAPDTLGDKSVTPPVKKPAPQVPGKGRRRRGLTQTIMSDKLGG